MRYSYLLLMLLGISSPAFCQSFENYAGEFPESVSTIYHHGVEMRDGIELATDIYLPAASGRFPTLLVRDIYSNGSTPARQRYAKFATANGYAFVFQSARGRYDSEGHWYPYFQEINDGDDTLSWIADQPWSNGKVGMFGSSYLASVQWLAALNRNPALVAIAPAMSPGNYYRDVAYPGGAFSLLSRARWGIGLVGSRTNMSFPVDWINNIDHLPLNTLAEKVGFEVRHFQDWLDHPSYDAYWEPLNLEARASEMTVPALNIGGWYDVFLRSTIGSYQTMRREAATTTARSGQRLIIGPWPHGWNKSSMTGDQEFGERALIKADELLLQWFDYWMKDGAEPGAAPVRIFVMGENVWRDELEWPLARTEYQRFYLHADTSLSRNRPTRDRSFLSYDYDPADPVPTLGGNIMEPTLRGPYDQQPLAERDDILRFQTDAFTVATEITGPIRATLYASSDATDTDFMAKLIVVKAGGEAFNLVDGVIRARYREGFKTPRLIEPGVVYAYEIDMWATSYRLSPGDRLRVDVTSSNYPRLSRNLNTGAAFAQTSEMKVARQTLHMSAEHSSHIVLPVVPGCVDCSTSIREATSFGGEPLYRRPAGAEALAEHDRQIAAIRSKTKLREEDYIEIGRHFVSTYRYRDAIEAYTEGLSQHPDSFKLRRHRAHRYISVRELNSAILDLQEALELIEDSPSGLIEYDAAGKPNGTYEHWVWYHIGLYHYLNEDFGSAARAFEKCVELSASPKVLVGASDWLYNAYQKNGEPDKAEKVVAAIAPDIAADHDHPYFKRVMLYKGVVKPEEILDLEKPADEWTAGDITIGYGVANWLGAQGDIQTANRIYGAILQSPYWNAWAYVVTDKQFSSGINHER